MGSTVLITGVAGLLGNHLARHLLSLGDRVIGVDNLSGGFEDLLPRHSNFEFKNFDLTDSAQLRSIFEEFKPSCTYHFAAYAAEGLSPFIRKFNYINNVVASSSVINACIEFESKIVFTSSMAVYGNQKPPFVESMRPEPIDPYGIAKFTVEQDLRAAGEQFGLRFNIVRPHNVVGIYQNIWDRYRNVLGIFLRKAIKGEPLTVYGDGQQTRAFSDVKYYLGPLKRLADGYDGETYNLGADRYVSILELAKMVQRAALDRGLSTEILHMEPRHEVVDAYCDHTKAKTQLELVDETDLEDMVSEMFDWALTQPSREVKSFDYELTKGIYSFWL